MLRLDNVSRPLDKDILSTPGGFAGWSVEILDEDHSGLVLVWSYGLPSGAKKEPMEPEALPALGVAVYERGAVVFETWHPVDPDTVSWDGAGCWRFGDTSIFSEDDGECRMLTIELDHQLGGRNNRLTGRIRVAGAIPRALGGDPARLGETRMAWAPELGPAFGTAMVRFGSEWRFSVAGRASFDRHCSVFGPDALGVQTCLWGRACAADWTRIFCILWPDAQSDAPVCVGFEIGKDGALERRVDLGFELDGVRKPVGGVPSWSRIELKRGSEPWLVMSLEKSVDRSPSHCRYLVRSNEGGPDRWVGSAGVLVPAKIGRGVLWDRLGDMLQSALG